MKAGTRFSFEICQTEGRNRGKKMMEELILPAEVERLDDLFGFIERCLEPYALKTAFLIGFNTAAEEIFVNVAHYAYPGREGDVRLQMSVLEDPLRAELCFIDSGIPYNPLKRKEPDISLDAEERPIGGLGIFMVKKMMDEVRYEYRDGCNRLTIVKKFPA